MKKRINVLYKPAGKPFELREIENTLTGCQELVGGYIETVRPFSDALMVLNEEGLIRNLPSNPFFGYDFRGDWFFCGADGDEFTDVPDGLVNAWKAGRLGGEPNART